MAERIRSQRGSGGVVSGRRHRCHATMITVSTIGSSASAGRPCVIPRRKPRLWPNGTAMTSISGKLAAIISVAVPSAVFRLSPASARAAPTSVWQTLSMLHERKQEGGSRKEEAGSREGFETFIREDLDQITSRGASNSRMRAQRASSDIPCVQPPASCFLRLHPLHQQRCRSITRQVQKRLEQVGDEVDRDEDAQPLRRKSHRDIQRSLDEKSATGDSRHRQGEDYAADGKDYQVRSGEVDAI